MATFWPLFWALGQGAVDANWLEGTRNAFLFSTRRRYVCMASWVVYRLPCAISDHAWKQDLSLLGTSVSPSYARPNTIQFRMRPCLPLLILGWVVVFGSVIETPPKINCQTGHKGIQGSILTLALHSWTVQCVRNCRLSDFLTRANTKRVLPTHELNGIATLLCHAILCSAGWSIIGECIELCQCGCSRVSYLFFGTSMCLRMCRLFFIAYLNFTVALTFHPN